MFRAGGRTRRRHRRPRGYRRRGPHPGLRACLSLGSDGGRWCHARRRLRTGRQLGARGRPGGTTRHMSPVLFGIVVSRESPNHRAARRRRAAARGQMRRGQKTRLEPLQIDLRRPTPGQLEGRAGLSLADKHSRRDRCVKWRPPSRGVASWFDAASGVAAELWHARRPLDELAATGVGRHGGCAAGSGSRGCRRVTQLPAPGAAPTEEARPASSSDARPTRSGWKSAGCCNRA